LDDRGLGRSVYGARVDGATGESLDPSGLALSSAGTSPEAPAVAFNGTDYLVVFTDYREGAWRLEGVRVSPDGTIVDGTPLSLRVFDTVSEYIQFPQVASDGDGWLVVYTVNAFSSSDAIAGLRVAADGTPDASPFPISNGHFMLEIVPRLAFG